MIWSELVRIALMGTDQTAVPESILDILAARGVETQTTSDQLVLDSAAIYHQMRKAGFVFGDFDRDFPNKIGSDVGPNTISFRSIRHLKKILSGTHQQALNEFVDLMVENQKQFPPEFLPEIFQICLTEASLWNLIAPRLGERAHWLLQLNPDWQSLIIITDDVDWNTAKSIEKKSIFHHLHQKAPNKANAFLQQDWPKMKFKQKLDYLAILDQSLVPSDEAFLESLRKDKRKEVRFQAAQLLSNLPQSALSKSLFKQVQQYIRTDAKGGVRIKLPEAVPAETAKQGIDLSKAKKHFKSGLKAAWLAALVSKIPPAQWESYLKISPRNIIEAFYASHLGDVLEAALIDAIIRHKDSDWAEQLIRFEMGRGFANQWPIQKLKKLIQLLSPATFNDVAYFYLQYNGSLLDEENHIITRMLISGQSFWDDRLSKLIIEGFRRWMTEAQTFYWNLLHYQKLLEAAAYYCPSHLVDSFSRDWPYHSPIWPRWEAAVQRFLQTLSFRKEMQEEMKN